VQVHKLTVAAGAEMPPRHVDGEGDIALPLLAQVLVVGDGDGKGPLLRVVHILRLRQKYFLILHNFMGTAGTGTYHT